MKNWTRPDVTIKIVAVANGGISTGRLQWTELAMQNIASRSEGAFERLQSLPPSPSSFSHRPYGGPFKWARRNGAARHGAAETVIN